jgi:hypothetical protein
MIATLTLADGTWQVEWKGSNGEQVLDGPGPYTVEGDQLRFGFPDDPVGNLTFTFSVDAAGNIDVEPDPSMPQDAQFVFANYQWERIDGGDVDESTDATSLNGTYRYEISEDEMLAAGVEPRSVAENFGVWTWTLEDSRFEFDMRNPTVTDHREGTYEITGDSIEFVIPGEPPGLGVFTWELESDGSIRLSDGPQHDPLYLAVFTMKPWERIDGGGVIEPAEATSLNATYRWTLTEDDAQRVAESIASIGEQLATFPWVFTMTLQDGTWTMRHDESGDAWVDCDTDDCTYAVDGDHIVFVWGPEGIALEFTFTVDDDGTVHLDPLDGVSADDGFVWSSQPWEPIG